MNKDELVKEIKKIFENEDESMELDEMARKAFNNHLTEKGKKEITTAVKNMIAQEKEGKVKHSDNFVFKTLAALAKKKVGEPITTTELQKVAGVKHPQPMNKLLQTLEKSELITRATSHVEPEKGEPKPKGRPKDPNKPEKEKKEKIDKFGGLPIKKDKVVKEPTDAEKNNTVTENDSYASISKRFNESLELEEIELDEIELDETETVEETENLEELNFNSLETSLTKEFGKDGNSKEETSELDEAELNKNNTALEPLDRAELNESLLTMKFRAGIITDTEYASKLKKLLK